MKELLDWIPRLRDKRIGVYGDLIADEYVYGTVHRFSREAPVFVVNYETSRIGPGGAANAVNNIHDLGGIPVPFGIIGDDPPGKTLLELLKEKGIPVDGIIIDPQHPTFVKQRIVAGSPHSVKQQILRIDRCQSIPVGLQSQNQLKAKAEAAIHKLDAFIVSDYGLGVAQPTILSSILKDLIRKNIPCFVDSRFNLKSYRGITAATPNEPELEAIEGNIETGEALRTAGQSLRDRLEARALLITRGKQGMMLVTEDSEPAMIPIFGSADIVDVTGAGDTVITAFAMGVAAGASFFDAARLANCAAGLVVMKRGAATVTPEELIEAIRVSGYR